MKARGAKQKILDLRLKTLDLPLVDFTSVSPINTAALSSGDTNNEWIGIKIEIEIEIEIEIMIDANRNQTRAPRKGAAI